MKQQKHQIQQASIIGHLQKKGVLPTSAASAAEACPTVFVEFGAGRGMLSSAIDVALPGANVLLVERDGVRNKADRSLRYRVGTTEGASAAEGASKLLSRMVSADLRPDVVAFTAVANAHAGVIYSTIYSKIKQYAENVHKVYQYIQT